MPISVKCPECDAPYKVPDEAAGKAIKCKKCGAKVPVPAAGAGGGEDAFAGLGDTGGGGDSGGGDAKEKKQGGSKKTLIIVGVVLLLLTCCLCLPGTGLGVWFFFVKVADVAKDAAKDFKIDVKDVKFELKDVKIDKKDKKASLQRKNLLGPPEPRVAVLPARRLAWLPALAATSLENALNRPVARGSFS